jgi:hypothetical protein
VEFTFEGYPLEETFHTPRLAIYPARTYAGLNLAAREQITALNALLDGSPEALDDQESLPFMPLFNAAQVFHSQAEWVEFENGRGVRYLTFYSQAILTINNQELFYTFQGMTDDREHYISLVLPVSTAVLPNTQPNLTPEEWEALSDEYEEYLAETVAELNALGPDDFLPTLSALDQLVQSLEINIPAARPINVLAMETPVRQGQYLAGETVAAMGGAPLNAGEVALAVWVGPNIVAEAVAAVDTLTGLWEAELPLPANMAGPARVIAQTATETVTHPITLYPESAEEGSRLPRITIYQPFQGETWVAGRVNFVNGTVQNPVGERVTIAVLVDDCTRLVAQQSFTVPRGDWLGQLILPAEELGPACLTAYTGPYGATGAAEGYEWLVPLLLVSADDPLAPRVRVVEPTTQPQRGVVWTLFGTAVNPPNNNVTVRIADVNGNELFQQVAAVDTFGYWEVDVTLPTSAPDFVVVVVGFVEDGEPVETQIGFVVR